MTRRRSTRVEREGLERRTDASHISWVSDPPEGVAFRQTRFAVLLQPERSHLRREDAAQGCSRVSFSDQWRMRSLET